MGKVKASVLFLNLAMCFFVAGIFSSNIPAPEKLLLCAVYFGFVTIFYAASEK